MIMSENDIVPAYQFIFSLQIHRNDINAFHNEKHLILHYMHVVVGAMPKCL